MKTVPSEESGPIDHSADENFHHALDHLLLLIGAKGTVNEIGADLSQCADRDSGVRDRAKQGGVEVLTRNTEKFVVLTADQVVALAQNTDGKRKRTMAELYPNLPFLPDPEDRPRYSPLASTLGHLRYRLKE
jgi:hypothetical protein